MLVRLAVRRAADEGRGDAGDGIGECPGDRTGLMTGIGGGGTCMGTVVEKEAVNSSAESSSQ